MKYIELVRNTFTSVHSTKAKNTKNYLAYSIADKLLLLSYLEEKYITVENIHGEWLCDGPNNSAYITYYSNGSYHINSSYDLAKITFKGYPTFMLKYGSYAESSYDYVCVSLLDYIAGAEWTYTTSSYTTGVLLHSSGKQNSLAPNLEYTFENDGGEHFIYILYRKDGSQHSNNDRGYFAFLLENYLLTTNYNINCDCTLQTLPIDIISDTNWKLLCNSEWCSVNATSGNGNARILADISVNALHTSRTAEIILYNNNTSYTINIQLDAYDIIVPASIVINHNTHSNINIIAPLGYTFEYSCEWLEITLNNNTLLCIATSELLTGTRATNITIHSNGISKLIKITLGFIGVIMQFNQNTSSGYFSFLYGIGNNQWYAINDVANKINMYDQSYWSEHSVDLQYSDLSNSTLYIKMCEDMTPYGITSRVGFHHSDYRYHLKTLDLRNMPAGSNFFMWKLPNFPNLELLLLPEIYNNCVIQLSGDLNNVVISNKTQCIISPIDGIYNVTFEEGLYTNFGFYLDPSWSDYNSNVNWLMNNAPYTTNGVIVITPQTDITTNLKLLLISKGYRIITIDGWLSLYDTNINIFLN